MEEEEAIPLEIRHSTTHPKYLHSNSTSHKWVFGAIAELVDNSVDAKASQFFVDVEDNPINPNDKLFTIRDNGTGMDPPHVHKMVSFGHCEKVDSGDGQAPIGHYGNGFKSGSMRIGKDAIVFTCDGKTRTVALLSQSYLEAIKAQEVLVPMASWTLDGKAATANTEVNIAAITKHSPFTSIYDINDRFDILGEHGTYIVVFNLRKLEDNLELDFISNQTDVRIKGANTHDEETPTKGKRSNHPDTVPLEEYSLRAYLSILYMQPHMQIFIRGHRVYSRRLRYSLWKKEDFLYRPNNAGQHSHVYITFGFNTRNKQHMGCFIYHRNRLIKMYMRVGIQFASDSRGVGVIGVVDASFLTPTHNKQDFVQNNLLKLLTNTLKDRLKDYWTNCNIDVSGGGIGIANWWQLLAKAPNKDLRWRQCDNLNCLKWRKLDKGYTPEPYVEWRCSMHPGNKYNCTLPEEKPEYKIAPKRKREELLEGLNKRPHLATAPSPIPTPTTSTSTSAAPSPIRFNPVYAPAIPDPSQALRDQLMRQNIAKQPPQQSHDLGQQQLLLKQAQQIREKLAQHHQMHVKPEPTPRTFATASIKQEPTQQQTTRPSAVINAPTVINLDQHECKGCEAMCQKMSALVNALGANISCDELHSSNFNPQMFVFQIRDAFLREIDSLKIELASVRARNQVLESNQTPPAQRVEGPTANASSRTSIAASDLPTTKVYHMGVDSSSMETRYNTFLTNYHYIDSKLAKASPPAPSSPASPVTTQSTPSSPIPSVPTPPPSQTPPPTTTPTTPTTTSTPSSSSTTSTTTTTATSNTTSSTTTTNVTNKASTPNTTVSTNNTTSDPTLHSDRLYVGRVSMLDLLKKKIFADENSTPSSSSTSSTPPKSTPSMRTAPVPIISSPSSPPTVAPAPTASSSSSTSSSANPQYSVSSASSGSRIRIQKVNVKAEPVDNIYEYANQEAIHISSTQDSQTVK